MAGRKKMHLNHVFVLRLTDSDNKLKDDIQNHGINLSEYIRNYIKELHKKIYKSGNF